MHIINSTPKGTASSMDDNRAEFYKYRTTAPSPTVADAFQGAYSRFVNMLVQGTCPEAISPYFNDGRAILLIKEASQEALHIDPTKYNIR
jgi:hypothetical protein